jgi:hypothetical protein
MPGSLRRHSYNRPLAVAANPVMMMPIAMPMTMLRLRRIRHPQHNRQRKYTQQDSFHIVLLLSAGSLDHPSNAPTPSLSRHRPESLLMQHQFLLQLLLRQLPAQN